MSVSEGNEGLKVESQACDVFCMPPKKRHLHRFQLMKSVSESINLPETRLQFEHGSAAREEECPENSRFACSEEALANKQFSKVQEASSINQNSIMHNLHGSHQGSQSVANAIVSTMVVDHRDVDSARTDDCEKFQLETRELDLPQVLQASSEPCMQGSIIENTPCDKSNFQEAESDSNNGTFSLLSLPDQVHKDISEKKERLNPCSQDIRLAKGNSSSHFEMEKFDCAQSQSDRSNWDLNTMMDVWEGSCSVQYANISGQTLQAPDESKIKSEDDAIPSSKQIPSFMSSASNLSEISLSIKPSIDLVGSKVFVTPSVKPELRADIGKEHKSNENFTQSVCIAVKTESSEHTTSVCSTVPYTQELQELEVAQNVVCTLAEKLEIRDSGSVGEIGTVAQEASSAIPLYLSDADKSDQNSYFISVTSTNHDSACDNNCLPKVQSSVVHCAPETSDIPTETNCKPASKLLDLEKRELFRNFDSFHLVASSHTSNCDGTSEHLFHIKQRENALLNPSSPNDTNSQIRSIIPATAFEGDFDQKPLSDSEASDNIQSQLQLPPVQGVTVLDTLPSRLQLHDQVVSEFETTVSNSVSDCGLPSDCTKSLPADILDNPVKTSSVDELASMSSGFSLLGNSVADLNENKVVAAQPKVRRDEDDDMEDGEVRDLNIRQTAVRSLCKGSEIKIGTDASCLIDPLVLMSQPPVKVDIAVKLNDLEEMAQPSTMVVCNSSGKDITAVGGQEDVQNLTFETGPKSEGIKCKLARAPNKRSKDDSRKEKCNIAKKHKSSSMAYKIVENGLNQVGSYVVEDLDSKSTVGNLCSPKHRLLESINDRNTQSSCSHSRTVHLMEDSKDPIGDENSFTKRHLSSQIERERPSNRSFSGGAPCKQGKCWDGSDDSVTKRKARQIAADSGTSDGSQKNDKDMRKDEIPRGKSVDELTQSWERIDKHTETSYGDQITEVDCASNRFGRSSSHRILKSRKTSEVAFAGADNSSGHSSRFIRNASLSEGLDDVSHACHRRRSPGAREWPVNVGVQMIRRPTRDVSPGRCSDGASDLLPRGSDERFSQQRMTGGDVMDPSAADAHTNFKREGVFLHRVRGVSPPLLRRVPSRLPRACSPSSSRRARSPRRWSPQRSINDFNMNREVIRGRSPPNVEVLRVRSPPHSRDGYIKGMPVRRCGSPPPCLPRLREDIRDGASAREFEYARRGVPLQRNLRRFRLITPHVNDDEYFGLVRSWPNIDEVLDEEYLGDRRAIGDRRGIICPIRHRYRDPVEDDLNDFQLKHEGPRPVRFRLGEGEAFTEREHRRGLRGRLGEPSRRMRSVEEQDGGRTWHDDDFDDDARPKRRRF